MGKPVQCDNDILIILAFIGITELQQDQVIIRDIVMFPEVKTPGHRIIKPGIRQGKETFGIQPGRHLFIVQDKYFIKRGVTKGQFHYSLLL
ncbi:hypothetical protein D9M69_512720 [compost metagenome]